MGQVHATGGSGSVQALRNQKRQKARRTNSLITDTAFTRGGRRAFKWTSKVLPASSDRPALPMFLIHTLSVEGAEGLVLHDDECEAAVETLLPGDLLRLDSLIALPSVLAAASYFWINIGVVPAMTCISQGARSSGSRR